MNFAPSGSIRKDGVMQLEELSARKSLQVLQQAAPTVFVLDGDRSLREWLEAQADLEWQTRFCASREELLAQPRSLAPACLLLDLQLPDGSLELQAMLAQRRELPIIFMTAQTNIPMTVRAMKAGAVDVLTKPFAGDTLASVIRSALERSRACIGSAKELRGFQERYASLSSREREVMSLVVSGLLNKQIGARLGIAEITVKAHRGKVMRKMAADSLARLITIAGRLGFTPFSHATPSVFEHGLLGLRRSLVEPDDPMYSSRGPVAAA
jgi:FixJ family two-component response regulator